MSTGEGIKVSYEITQMVQDSIEQCLVHYMTQKQVIHVLKLLQNIEPIFTVCVWQLLEEENPEFFKSYYLRLAVKEQIVEYNKLLAKQAALIYQADPRGATFPPMFNVSHMPAMAHNGSRYVSESGIFQKTENKHLSVPRVVVGGYNSYGVPSNMVLPNIGMIQQEGITRVKREPGDYVGNFYQTGGNILGPHPASVSPFSTMDPNSQDDTSSFEFFRELSQNIGLPDLAPDFTNRSGPSTRHRM